MLFFGSFPPLNVSFSFVFSWLRFAGVEGYEEDEEEDSLLLRSTGLLPMSINPLRPTESVSVGTTVKGWCSENTHSRADGSKAAPLFYWIDWLIVCVVKCVTVDVKTRRLERRQYARRETRQNKTKVYKTRQDKDMTR